MAIRITDELYSSAVEGVVADSSTIRGGYITVETATERDALNKGPLVNGQPVYVVEENKTYRWNSSTSLWVEDNALATSVTEHINNKNNPHGVTAAQLGLDKVENTADKDKPISDATQDALDVINASINDIKTSLDGKLDDSGAQAFTGDLTIVKGGEHSGSLTVQGDLIVNGTTTTVEHETLAVKDSLIIANSDGEDLGTTLSGLSIKTSTEGASYGIVFDPNDDSVKLGVGTIDESGLFSFDSEEGNPILVRDQADNLEDNHLLVWDKENSRAVDGGAIPTLESLGGVTSTDLDEIKTQISEVESDLNLTNQNVESLQTTVDGHTTSITNL